MNNLNLQRFLLFIVDFLYPFYIEHSKKKLDFYNIPLNLLLNKLNISKTELFNSIDFKDLGLVLIKNEDEIVKIKEKFLDYINQFSMNLDENRFRSALELYNPNSLEKNEEKLISGKENIKKIPILVDEDFNNGLIHINSVPKFAEVAIKFIEIEKVVKIFNWKNFEDLISNILQNFGYRSITNFRFSLDKNSKKKYKIISKTTKKPQKRFEVDIIGISPNRDIIFIDAKYWKINSDHSASLSTAADFQSARASNFSEDLNAIRKLFELFNDDLIKSEIKKISKIKKNLHKSTYTPFTVYPMIVYTGFSSKKINYSGVPIVALNHFSDFLQNFSSNKDLFIKYKIKKIEFQTQLS